MEITMPLADNEYFTGRINFGSSRLNFGTDVLDHNKTKIIFGNFVIMIGNISVTITENGNIVFFYTMINGNLPKVLKIDLDGRTITFEGEKQMPFAN